MNIGIALWNITAANYEVKIARIKSMGFNSISFLSSSFETDSGEKIAELIKKNNLSITFHLSFYGTNAVKLLEALDIRLKSIREFIEQNGLESNLKCIGFDPAFDEDEKNEVININAERTISALKFTLKVIPYGRMAVENWSIGGNISLFEKIKREVNKRLGMLLDIGHLHISLTKKLVDRNDLAEYINSIPMDIVEVHVHDNGGELDSHLPLGRGNMDYQKMFGEIKASGKTNTDTVFTLELKPHLKNISLTDSERMQEVINTRELTEKAFK